MLRVLHTFTLDRTAFALYVCDDVGDELPLHSHTFNHLTLPIAGVIEVFTNDGVSRTGKPGDKPFEYVAGRVHGIRGLTAGAMFLNISPTGES